VTVQVRPSHSISRDCIERYEHCPRSVLQQVLAGVLDLCGNAHYELRSHVI
jgi:hypothetical protein